MAGRKRHFSWTKTNAKIGCLSVTPDDVHFALQCPRRGLFEKMKELALPHFQTVQKSFTHKTNGSKLLWFLAVTLSPLEHAFFS